MCGIWAFLQKKEPSADVRSRIPAAQEAIRPRGPENFQTKVFQSDDAAFRVETAFARLAINGLNEAGNQPFGDTSLAWMCNGEIYNSEVLDRQYAYTNQSGSDCECLGVLWKAETGAGGFYFEADVAAIFNKLRGVYAGAYIDCEKKEVIAFRDPFGVRPLYCLESKYGVFLASERKALDSLCEEGEVVNEYPPGTCTRWQLTRDGQLVKTEVVFFKPEIKVKFPTIDYDTAADLLYRKLSDAVSLRLKSDRPICALLSGGLDSSVICALVNQQLRAQGKPPLKTFSIGMEGSSDLAYAKQVAGFIDSDHTEILVTADEMFDCIPQVIHDIESFDITTVRASVGNWILGREIAKRTDCKVVFNGDGSDEIFGSYLYFYNAPSDKEFDDEVVRLLENIHKYDVLRSDRSISSHGLEARTPFLDTNVVSFLHSLPTKLRRPLPNGGQLEKILLRLMAKRQGILPFDVIFRRKEAFSDGVSGTEKAWYQIIQEKLNEKQLVPADWRERLASMPTLAAPKTEEAFYYYSLFLKEYSHIGDPMDYWMPKWCPETNDPSARTLAVYN